MSQFVEPQHSASHLPRLPVETLQSALMTLMAARPDAAFLVDRKGQIAAESPAAASLRARTPVLSRILAGYALQGPKRSAFHTVPGLSLRFAVQACAAGDPGSPLLIVASPLDQQPHRAVTLRQRQLLAYVRAGLRNAEIAQRMQIQPSTVKTMLERLYRMAGVPNRQALARWASENQLN